MHIMAGFCRLRFGCHPVQRQAIIFRAGSMVLSHEGPHHVIARIGCHGGGIGQALMWKASPGGMTHVRNTHL